MPSFFLLLQRVHDKVHDPIMKLDYSEPNIYTGGVDINSWSKLSKEDKKEALSKSWYVYYSFRDPKTGKLKRQTNIKAGANQFKTKRERYSFLRTMREALSKLLELGFNPYKDNSDLEAKLFSDNQEPAEKQSKPKPTPALQPEPGPVPVETEEDIMSIDQAFKFGLSMKEHMMNTNSYVQYKSRIGLFEKWLREEKLFDKPITSITKKTVNQYLNTIVKKTSARNRNNSRTDIASLFQLLEENEIVKSNFVQSIPKLKTVPKRNKTYTPDQEKKINTHLEKHDPTLHLFIKFISLNFLRPIEVCRLKIRDVDLKDKKLYVKAKNQPVKIKIIPDILIKDIPDLSKLPGDALLFGRFGIGEAWSASETNRRNEFSKRFKEVKDHFGLGEEFGLYSFRHTFITKLYRKLREKSSPNETKSKLMLITGHSTMDALEKYLRDIDAELPEDYSHLFK
ncbi:tyrosine-type recombinase/integrase [Psychroflexus sediminis]|uniref:Site-specific recombinase XerD n=1 Tax=Psychroflexus sediminis TaxID=470826 RepID=A0A1G7U8D0_9FLAO|nr:site-specific integrase [Psychroflexus sediminis]SDG43000.1 Site-specific recombinase XerD [Psychroflexus sediminis]